MKGEISRCDDWQEVDRELRGIAKRRAALDVEEARWLREAHRLMIWREVGCGSIHEYLERRLGYTPHTANERLRVALAIERMPGIELALESGELPFSAIRELTRVANDETQDAWLEAAKGKSVHEIQQLVAGHKKGNKPTDRPDPELKPRRLSFEVLPETYAMVRQVRQQLASERGHFVDDNELVAAMCAAMLGEEVSRARAQITIRRCDACAEATQEGAGREIAIDAAAAERAACDAEQLAEDGTVTVDIPAKTRRAVWLRDMHKCRVPGCRATRNLEIHHILPREAGGGHELDNLMLLCNGHHDDLHRGTLTIRGSASQLQIERHVETKLQAAVHHVEARSALVGLGYKPQEAKAAVEYAQSHVGQGADFDTFLRTALKYFAMAYKLARVYPFEAAG